MSQARRNFGLDIIRFAAIILVLIAHSMYLFYPVFTGFGEVLFNFAKWATGAYGVELFFILSGFLIGGIFIRDVVCESARPINTTTAAYPVRRFYLKRIIRTLPNYILYFFVFYFADLYFRKGNFLHEFPLKNFFLVANFYEEQGRGFMGVAWSLSVEEFFYLFLPCFYLLFYKTGWSKMKAFLASTFLLLVVPNLLKIYYTLGVAPSQGFINHNIIHTTIYRLDSIAYGILLAIAYHCEFAAPIKRFLQANRYKLLIAGILLTIVGLAYNFLFVVKPTQTAAMIYWSYPLRSIGLLLLFPFFIDFSYERESRVSGFITYTSLISYSIYLSHVVIIESLKDVMHTNGWHMPALVHFILIWVMAYIVSAFTYHRLEKPVLRLRDKLIGR